METKREKHKWIFDRLDCYIHQQLSPFLRLSQSAYEHDVKEEVWKKPLIRLQHWKITKKKFPLQQWAIYCTKTLEGWRLKFVVPTGKCQSLKPRFTSYPHRGFVSLMLSFSSSEETRSPAGGCVGGPHKKAHSTQQVQHHYPHTRSWHRFFSL